MLDLPADTFIPLDQFMLACNAHYYDKRPSVGKDGDFITAPEISQMFGEMMGAWVISQWDAMGKPAHCKLIEIGPGRGTMMADALRVIRPYGDVYASLSVHMVENSEKLRILQRYNLQGFSLPTHWHESLADVPDGPFILLANEFLDALPIKQITYTALGWLERGVTLRNGKAEWATQPLPHDWQPDIPPHIPPPVPGNILEASPAVIAVVGDIVARLKKSLGCALFIDYGYAVPNYGDTLQAVYHHQYADPLERLGDQDLTAHVNFSVLENMGHLAGLHVDGPMGQGEFLANVGIQVRAERLLDSTTDPTDKLEILEGLHRLTHPSEMGTLFKALCLSTPGLSPTEGFYAS